MKKMKKPTTKGLIFNGASEYWGYKGICDSLYKKVSDPETEIEFIPFINNQVGKECAECYLLGFYLGQEIRISTNNSLKETK